MPWTLNFAISKPALRQRPKPMRAKFLEGAKFAMHPGNDDSLAVKIHQQRFAILKPSRLRHRHEFSFGCVRFLFRCEMNDLFGSGRSAAMPADADTMIVNHR